LIALIVEEPIWLVGTGIIDAPVSTVTNIILSKELACIIQNHSFFQMEIKLFQRRIKI
jgi:hypothetical protein